jgi:hypothetical protein
MEEGTALVAEGAAPAVPERNEKSGLKSRLRLDFEVFGTFPFPS